MSNFEFTILIFLPILLVSISLHESMHALASHWLGDDSAKEGGRVSINPLKHIDPVLSVALPVVLALLGQRIFAIAKPVYVNMNRVKYDEFGGAIIGMVGPLTNLLLAVIAAGVIKGFHIHDDGSLTFQIADTFLSLNIILFVFNSIPFPPLDGSRLLYAFAPAPLQRFMNFIEQQGLMGLLLFFFVIYPTLTPIVFNLYDHIRNSLVG